MAAFMFADTAIASYVVAMRKKKGWNQRQLAEALGREQNYVARVETGQRRLDLVEWITLCHACGVDPAKETAKLLKQVTPMVKPPAARQAAARKR